MNGPPTIWTDRELCSKSKSEAFKVELLVTATRIGGGGGVEAAMRGYTD